MNVINTGPLYLFLLLMAAGAVAIVTTLNFLVSRKTRARYPGGAKRYALALVVQATAFILPLPFVTLWLMGRVPPGLDVILAFVAGVAAIYLVRLLPVVGPLLKDLARARLEVALERHAPFSNPEARK